MRRLIIIYIIQIIALLAWFKTLIDMKWKKYAHKKSRDEKERALNPISFY